MVFKNILAILGPVFFHLTFRARLSRSMKTFVAIGYDISAHLLRSVLFLSQSFKIYPQRSLGLEEKGVRCGMEVLCEASQTI